ncbi:MAG: polyprenyl synthetase family protein [Geminicoccaceae bacterium]|nr:MAG: polyprenyl synthetase family protein [Geminicoccaceae bacterium]
MVAIKRIEQTLETAIDRASGPGCPPKLAAAMRHAVFPGGARIRPRLCLAVAHACGDDRPELTEAAAAAIELLHCASLVHDDLPCFDDAATRRGRPSVHAAFGEPVAVLAGDAMIVLAFETLARHIGQAPDRVAKLMQAVAQAVGGPSGIVAGQAWESEPLAVLQTYQRAKTGSLFVAATACGAAAAGADPVAWHDLGDRLGEAYQVADDLHDAAASEGEMGKPVGQDAAHHRPSAALELGVSGAVTRLERLVQGAVEAIPPCRNAGDLEALVKQEAKRLLPKSLARHAA